MGGLRFSWVLLAGCFQPTPTAGAPCGPGGACPRGQECRGEVCFAIGAPFDAPIGDDADIDAPVDAPIDAPPVVKPFGNPVPIPGVNGTAADSDASMTANQLTIAFTSTRDGNEDIFIGTRAAIGDAFVVTKPMPLVSASTDHSPEISADGKTLYFTSDRTGAMEVYKSTFAGGVWSAPIVVPELSGAYIDDDVAISPDGLTAMIGEKGSPTGSHMILHVRANTAALWGAGVAHDELKTPTGDLASPSLTNNGALLYFHAGATRDIYRAVRLANGSYDTPAPVTAVNTGVREAGPFISADDKVLIFERDGELMQSTRQ